MKPCGGNAPCPCGTGRKFKACCAPVIEGAAAASPEALMRSRYTAYATGAVTHLLRSVHPGGPHAVADERATAASLRAYCAAVDFTGLEVHESAEAGDEGRVRFTARYLHAGEPGILSEHSRFLRVAGRWSYWGAVE